jgi:Ribonuclease G/E
MNTGTTICPKCGGAQAIYASETVTLTIPVRLRWLFINISQDVKITVSPSVVYDPACGHLKISLAQAKQI